MLRKVLPVSFAVGAGGKCLPSAGLDRRSVSAEMIFSHLMRFREQARSVVVGGQEVRATL